MLRQRSLQSRTLGMETLEQRALLSVTVVPGSITYKSLAISILNGVVTAHYSAKGLSGNASGTAELTGSIQYTSATKGNGNLAAVGSITDPMSVNLSESGLIAANNGSLSGQMDMGQPKTVKVTGKLDVKNLAMTVSVPKQTISAGGVPVTISNAKFTGTVVQSGAAFDVVISPFIWWSANAKGKQVLNVSVSMPGQLHTAKSASTAIATIDMYWADASGELLKDKKGNVVKPIAGSTIKLYWNQSSGQYQISAPNFKKIPTGAAYLALVTKFDGEIKHKQLVFMPSTTVVPINAFPPDLPHGAPICGLVTTESGDSAKFSVVLTSKPIADVTILIQSDDTTEGTVSTDQLVFTPDNWNVPQDVLVKGVSDTDEADVVYTVSVGPSQSSDNNYQGKWTKVSLINRNVKPSIPLYGAPCQVLFASTDFV